MILMYSEKGGYMYANNHKEVSRLEAKGWVVAPVKAPAKKARKKRVSK